MPRFTFSYEVNGQILATIERDADVTTRSIMYCCPNCGNLWARVRALRKPDFVSELQPTPWSALMRLCLTCGDGSFHESAYQMEDWPPPLLAHEVLAFNPQTQQEIWP